MNPTPYTDVNSIIEELFTKIHPILGTKLVGFYVFGSLVNGDFDLASSDIDMWAALASDLDAAEFHRLQAIHQDFARAHPQWDDRIEVAYTPLAALRTITSQVSTVATILPGEPFHCTNTRKDWVIDLYTMRQKGITLYGEPPTATIPPLTQEDFTAAIREHARLWQTWINDVHTRQAQAYAILTTCRMLYAYRNGEQTSKPKAAAWAAAEFPESAALIERAVQWRQNWRTESADPQATLPKTRRFIESVLATILDASDTGGER